MNESSDEELLADLGGSQQIDGDDVFRPGIVTKDSDLLRGPVDGWVAGDLLHEILRLRPVLGSERGPQLRHSCRVAGSPSGGLLAAVVQQLATPGAFAIQLSLFLLAGVVIGGLGSLWGAVWGAILLVLLPSWTTDLAHSFSLSTNVANNLPLAIYGVVLILAMLLWPTGIQGGVRALRRRAAALRPQAGTPSRAA